MLNIQDTASRLCDGLTRRDWLRVGGLGLAGLSLPGLLNARQTQADPRHMGAGFGKAKACIVLFFLGGPPQHETWDPKPNAPVEVSGDLRPISSSVPGLQVGELMPRTARLAHKIAVLRAVTTFDSAHSSSGYAMLTGMPHAPRGVENARPGAPNNWPSMGAIVRHLQRDQRGLAPAITLPERLANDGNLTWPGLDGGFLGRAADPWVLNCDPSAADFRIPELTLAGDVPAHRFDERRSLLTQVNAGLDELDRVAAVSRYDLQTQQAVDLLRSRNARQAFDLSHEPAALRDRYGRDKFGQSVLLARRLVEAGVSLVQVTWTRVPNALNNGHWDTHSNNSRALKTALMPRMDLAYSALLEDLEQRGLFDETLVVWMGEFGRTPRINGNGGRDHWGPVFSVALAGGGVRGGVVHGASDNIGGQPKEGRVQPQDFTATVFHSLGYAPDTEMHDVQGRPMPITRGDVVKQIF